MNITINDILSFENNKYIVIDIIDNRYLYLINSDSIKNDIAIVKIADKYNNMEIKYIDDDDEFNYVLYKLYLKNKSGIFDYFK